MVVRTRLNKGESIESALRRFKKSCEKEDILQDIKRNSFFEKNCEKKRRKQRKLEKELARKQKETADANRNSIL